MQLLAWSVLGSVALSTRIWIFMKALSFSICFEKGHKFNLKKNVLLH